MDSLQFNIETIGWRRDGTTARVPPASVLSISYLPLPPLTIPTSPALVLAIFFPLLFLAFRLSGVYVAEVLLPIYLAFISLFSRLLPPARVGLALCRTNRSLFRGTQRPNCFGRPPPYEERASSVLAALCAPWK